MWRSLSTKLLLAVLAAVILPFGGFAFYLQNQIAGRLTTELVRKSLLGLAGDLAEDVERRLEDLRSDLELWAAEPIAFWALDERAAEFEGPSFARYTWGPEQALALARGEDEGLAQADYFRLAQSESLGRYVDTLGEFDLLLLVDDAGHLVCCSAVDGDGAPLDEALIHELFAYDYARAPWFDTAIDGGVALQDQHVSPFLHPAGPPPRAEQLAEDFAVGLAVPVFDPSGAWKDQSRTAGVLYALVNWRTFQGLVDQPVIQDAFRGLVSSDEQPSPYAWIWGRDADTILAHRNRRLYGQRISGGEIALPSMRDDALAADYGMYRDYVFMGKKKTAAFWHTAGSDRGGFGWIVGVGIDYDDIYKASSEQRRLLTRGTLAVLLLVLLWMAIIARRTTEPIARLERHTRAVAGGDLSARVHIDRSDELGQLADAMNSMTRDLERNRAALIKAEKDAAWREMARQVAHDLKNPLTPIQLSLDLLERSRAEGSDQAEQILERTLELMRRQVQSLRATATEFYEFTGGAPASPEPVPLAEAIRNVLLLHRAWGESAGIETTAQVGDEAVLADPNKLERVLTNLVSNAYQAMPDGGRLEIVVERRGDRVVVRVVDEGVGLTAEAAERLFEPYFTTKGGGTGLGLAVAARFVEEMGGELALEPRADGRPGASATIDLPLYRADDGADGGVPA